MQRESCCPPLLPRVHKKGLSWKGKGVTFIISAWLKQSRAKSLTRATWLYTFAELQKEPVWKSMYFLLARPHIGATFPRFRGHPVKPPPLICPTRSCLA